MDHVHPDDHWISQRSDSTGMVLILMSATVDVEELKNSIACASEIEIDRHGYSVTRYYLERPGANSTADCDLASQTWEVRLGGGSSERTVL